MTFTTPAYYQDKSRLALIRTIMNAFGTIGYIKKSVELERDVFDGKVTYRKVMLVDFDGEESVKELTKGIHTIPG